MMTNIGRIKVVEAKENINDCICVCPCCGSKVTYGEMMLTNGVHNCPNCNLALNRTLYFDKLDDYKAYSKKMAEYGYEPYRYKEENNE